MPDGRTPFQRNLDEFERRLGGPEPSPPKPPWLRRSFPSLVIGRLALAVGLLGLLFLVSMIVVIVVIGLG